MLGIALAWWGQHALRAAAPASIPRVDQVTIDGGVLAFALLVTSLTGMLFGLIPALRGTRGDTVGTLREGGKTSSQFGIGRARGVLVVSEVALAVVLLTGAGLMVRSLWKLQSIELGFNPKNVLVMRVSFPNRATNSMIRVDRSASSRSSIAISRSASRRLPGVRSVGAVGNLPIAGGIQHLVDPDRRLAAAAGEPSAVGDAAAGYAGLLPDHGHPGAAWSRVHRGGSRQTRRSWRS